MDTEAIASEIVSIRRRLAEIDNGSVGDGSIVAADDEQTPLRERLRELQDSLSDPGAPGQQDQPAESRTYRYVPPA